MEVLIYWPFDEVTLKPGKTAAEIAIESPWLSTTVTMQPNQVARAQALVAEFQKGLQFSPQLLVEINWFFQSLADFPFCYIVPRLQWDTKTENYAIKDTTLANLVPDKFLKACATNKAHEEDFKQVSQNKLFQESWKWDAAAGVQFSTSSKGIDPKALFSVARRFHLLNSVENDGTEKAYAYVRALTGEKFKKASALMVRQNHYVTERCHAALTPAIALAKGAADAVKDFIQAEYGHDRILNSAMKMMGEDATKIPVIPSSKVLMDLLRFAAERNFLAFAIVVDYFERSSYQDSDPLAQVLAAGGEAEAAKQIDRHKDINDSGAHENVALSFLNTMGPVSQEYAIEALRIAEVTSNVMNLVGSGTQFVIEKTDYLAID